ncbi:hypothetical protein HQN90_29595 [Paenibacillus alba]|uniref:hypothetical protein n=1 Tax=Paenibacillus alba TaxID=1197127 RepID=UPI00156761BD|nr:hypothetical protein [Paenibacillus alba]NQX70301.1 hypothetical protein [Paenibacillus alba]
MLYKNLDDLERDGLTSYLFATADEDEDEDEDEVSQLWGSCDLIGNEPHEWELRSLIHEPNSHLAS